MGMYSCEVDCVYREVGVNTVKTFEIVSYKIYCDFRNYGAACRVGHREGMFARLTIEAEIGYSTTLNHTTKV